MAPKNQVPAKRKTTASSSGTIHRSIPLPRNPDRNRFSSNKTYDRYLKLIKGTWHDKVIRINPVGPFAHLLQMLTDRKWDTLLSPTTMIDPDIVREFYANAMPDCEKRDMDTQFSYTTFVRGKAIHFDRDAINTYLGNPLTLPPPEDPTVPTLCEYGRKEEDKEWDHEEIVRDILLPGRRYKRGKTDDGTTASYADMTFEAAFIHKFLVHNVWPKSHVSTTPKAVTPLIWHILKGGEVDVARIISRELKYVALSGLTHKASKMSFPGFIMGLVKSQGVVCTGPFTETLVGPMDDKFLKSLEKAVADKLEEPSSSIPHPEHEPELPQQEPLQSTEPGSFDFSSFSSYFAQQEQRDLRQEQRYQMQEQRDHFLMDQNAALFRSHRGIYQSLYDARQNPAYQMLTPESFVESCMWPGDRPTFYGGGEHYGAAEDDERTASVHGVDDMEDDAANQGPQF